MKILNKWLIVALIGFTTSLVSCVDDFKFGNEFLEKAPGGTVTKDTVFSSAEYTRQFLTGLYSLQYYGLPFGTNDAFPYMHTGWVGKWENLSDLWHTSWDGQAIQQRYYTGIHNSGYSKRQEKFEYSRMNVWEAVRMAWLLIENIEEVPGMDNTEKQQIVAQAKCIIASRYWDTFRHYGGLPIIKASFSGTEPEYVLPRGTVEETVDFMIELLDEASQVLPWKVSVPANETGRWTKAGAMGLKTSILLFAASPLFNDEVPYSSASPQEGVQNLNVWYGGYKPELWNRCLTACEEFFAELNKNGGYHLQQADGTRPSDYRLAFRKAYFRLTSPEVLHSTRVLNYEGSRFNSSRYTWHSWQKNNNRMAYNPTQEYVEMFPWADGSPFNWEEAEQESRLDEMFIKRTADPSKGVNLTRDPRLYETAMVNGLPRTLDWSTGNMSGNPYELWVGGYDAKQAPESENGRFATGYALMKYYLDDDAGNQDTHWSYIRLPEVMFNYAEVLCQKGRLQEAINLVDEVRARVGLNGLVESNPDKNLTSDKDALLKEILREKSCELGMEDSRFFDMIRYKMEDQFEKQLHRLKITRVDGGGQWFGKEKDSGIPWPEFKYERLPIGSPTRVWWTEGFDPKWYLSPFELGELNKGYGLVQNPGW